MKTFKQFLHEGGAATAKFETSRANAADIDAALKFVSKATGIEYDTLKSDLLGSTELTLLGKKKDSGDIDIAFSSEQADPKEIDRQMLAAVDGAGGYNSGTKVGSYAVPVNGKKVQVDLMFVNSKEWAKFAYHSSQGDKSKYSGAVRKMLLHAAITHVQKPGKDFILRDKDGRTLVRAAMGMTNETGLRRMFKMAKYNEKTGEYGKTVVAVTPEQIEAHLKAIGKDIEFSHAEDLTDNPDAVAAYVFGSGVQGRDLMTAEQVIEQIKKLPNAREIIAYAKKDLERQNLEVPTEL